MRCFQHRAGPPDIWIAFSGFDYIMPRHIYVKAMYRHMATRLKSAALNLYVLPELKAAAEKTAADDQRSLTSLVEKLLTDAARKAGHWPPPEKAKGKR